MKAAVLQETFPGERRVALVPATIPAMTKAGLNVVVQAGAGKAAGFSDDEYTAKGATIVPTRQDALQAEIVLQVRTLGANKTQGREDLAFFRPNQIVIGMADPLGEPQASADVAKTGATLFALELIPRITRAQSMDILSSQATIAGYRAVLLASMELPKIFPMLMTAAGTIKAAHVFVIGAGVAGLQAIATAKKLGAIVQAYDVRAACREQVESVGGKFVEMKLENAGAEDKGGYAKQMDETFYQRQRELMASVVAHSDVVITTALIPGKRSPLLVTAQAVAGMSPGSVIVDLAAERGGNCELSKPDQRVVEHGVTILGPTNLASDFPNHASQMYSNNIAKFLLNMIKKGEFAIDLSDPIVAETLIARGGDVTHAKSRELLQLSPLETQNVAKSV